MPGSYPFHCGAKWTAPRFGFTAKGFSSGISRAGRVFRCIFCEGCRFYPLMQPLAPFFSGFLAPQVALHSYPMRGPGGRRGALRTATAAVRRLPRPPGGILSLSSRLICLFQHNFNT